MSRRMVIAYQCPECLKDFRPYHQEAEVQMPTGRFSVKPIIHRICRWCSTPLTKTQIYRRRSYCSRSCAKLQHHAMHPESARKALKGGWATLRKRYVARLGQTLTGCKTLGDAYRRGYATGYRCGYCRKQRAA